MERRRWNRPLNHRKPLQVCGSEVARWQHDTCRINREASPFDLHHADRLTVFQFHRDVGGICLAHGDHARNPRMLRECVGQLRGQLFVEHRQFTRELAKFPNLFE